VSDSSGILFLIVLGFNPRQLKKDLADSTTAEKKTAIYFVALPFFLLVARPKREQS
jgi:hypothetical protein